MSANKSPSPAHSELADKKDIPDSTDPLPASPIRRTSVSSSGSNRDAAENNNHIRSISVEAGSVAPALVEVSITPFAARLLSASYCGNVVMFESVLEDYRAAKGASFVNPIEESNSPEGSRASSPATSPIRRRFLGTRRDPKATPNAVDSASTELLSHSTTKKEVSGVALFWAGFAGHSPIIHHIQQRYEAVFVQQCRSVARKLLDAHKDLAAVSLVVRLGTPAMVVSEGKGETTLHRLARRTKPDAALMNELLKTYKKHRTMKEANSSKGDEAEGEGGEEEEDDVDALNNDGHSALQIVAMNSKGIDGRTAAQVLISHGADVLLPSPKGGNARTLAQNPHVRAALGYQSCASPAIDEESKQEIDKAKTIFDLPPLAEIEGEVPNGANEEAERKLNPNAATEEEKSLAMRSICKLDKEGVDNMVRRLYDNTIQLREEKAASRRQALEIGESRRLTADEQQAVSERLCNESMDSKAAKMEELQEKYLVEREPNPLDEETQTESAARLCNQALDHKRVTMKRLDEQYWPADASPKKVISKEQMRACAARLHDESNAQTQAKFEKLASKYLAKSKGEFTQDRKQTREEREQALNRLTQPKGS